ncbi:uncharacterized protein [Anabrus simplex]|uniref:uncharacterized protein n=1 Tax=Anabrus simplex TaxID=316456 RepID=UPI0035A334FD
MCHTLILFGARLYLPLISTLFDYASLKMEIQACRTLCQFFSYLAQSDEDIVVDLQRQGLSKKAGKCPRCRRRVPRVMEKKSNVTTHLGHILHCRKCKKTKSLAEGTFFEKSHLLMYLRATSSTVGVPTVQSGIIKGRGPLASPCHNDVDCVTKHAHCKNGFCACRVQFVPSQRRDSCLTVSSMGGACNETEQCFSLGELGICQQHKCVCALGSEWNLQREECVTTSSADRATQFQLPIMAALTVVCFSTRNYVSP